MEEKKDILSSLNGNVEEIKDNVKSFGPKLPSKDESTENREYIVESIDDVVQVLIGSFSQLVYGQINKRKIEDFNGLIGKPSKDTIFGKISNVSEILLGNKGSEAAKFGVQLANGISKSKDYYEKLQTSIKKGIDESELAKNLITNSPKETVKKVEDDTSKKESQKVDFEIKGEVGELTELVKELNKVETDDKDKTKYIESLSKLLMTLDNIANSKKLHNLKRNLSKILDVVGKDNILGKFLDNLNELGTRFESKDSIKALECISNFLFNVERATYVSPLHILKLKLGIWSIRKFLMKDFAALMTDISKLATVSKEQNESLTAVANLINGILNISNISLKKWLWAYLNLGILTNYIDEVSFIIEDIKEQILSKLTKEDTDSLKLVVDSFKDLISLIEGISGMKIKANVDILSELMDTELPNVFKGIHDVGVLAGESKENALIIPEVFGYLNDSLNSLPSLKTTIAADIKLDIIDGSVKLIKKILERIYSIDLNGEFTKEEIMGDISYYFQNIGTIDELILDISPVVKNSNKILSGELTENTENIGIFIGQLIQLETLAGDKSLEGVKKLFGDFNSLPYSNLPGADDMYKLLSTEEFINTFIKNFPTDSKFKEDILNDIISGLSTVLEEFSKNGNIGKFFDDSSIGMIYNKDDVDNIINVIEIVKVFSKLSIGRIRNTGDNIDRLMLNISSIVQAFSKNGHIGQHINDLTEIKPENFKKIDLIKEFINTANDIINQLVIISKIPVTKDPENSVLVKLAKVLKTAIDKFNEIDIKEENVKELNNLIKSFMFLVYGSVAVLLFAGLTMKIIPVAQTLLFGVLLTTFIATTTWAYLHNAKELKVAAGYAQDLAVLVVASGLVLILGGLVATPGVIAGALFFAIELGLFIWALTKSINGNVDGLKNALSGLQDLAILVGVSGYILILAGKILNLADVGSAFLFAITLGLFVSFICAVISGVAEDLQEALKGLRDISILVVASGLILILAGKILNIADVGSAFGFAITLAVFIFGLLTGIFGAISLAGKMGNLGDNPQEILKNSLRGLRDIAILVVASGLVLTLGSYVFNQISVGSLLGFTAILFVFILGTIYAISLATKNAKKSLRGIGEFSSVIMAATICLLIGGTFLTLFPDVINGLMLYTLVLTSFIIGIGFAAKLAGQNSAKTLLSFAGLTLVTILASWVLLHAAKVIGDNPNLMINVALFGLVLLGFVAGLVGIMWLLSKVNTLLIKGLISLLIMVGITALASIVLLMVYDMYQKINFWDLLKGIGTILLAITALGAGFAAIGALASFVLPFLGIAAIVITGICGLVYLIVNTLELINNVMPKIRLGTDGKGGALGLFKQGVEALHEIAETIILKFGTLQMIVLLPSILSSLNMLSITISNIGRAISEYANLIVGENYRKNQFGIWEPTRFRKLKRKDFKEAANNVKEIITVLGGAIIDAYNKRPDIFITNMWGNSPFMHVTKSMKTLGPMLAQIARSVKEYADLKIPEYKGTKVVSYKHLTPKDFEEAAKNVNQIISVLGYAVIEAYDTNPEIFETSFWGNSKFSKVTRALGTLGPMIANIAKGVKDYASLIVGDPTTAYMDKDGAIRYRKFRTLKGGKDKNSDFVKARDNVKDIISTLGNAIIAAYEEHPDYYETSGGIFGFGSTSPFTRTIKANMKLADLITEIGQAIRDYSSLAIGEPLTAYTDKDGRLRYKKYRVMKNEDFSNASINISRIISTLGDAVMESYKDHQDWYEETGGIFGLGAKSPFTRVVSANIKLAELITSIGKSVRDFSNFQVAKDWKVVDGKPVATGYEPIGKKHFEAAIECIGLVINTLGMGILESIERAPKEIKEAYDEPTILGIKTGGKSRFTKVVQANMELGELISKIAKGVLEMANGKVATGWDKDGKATGYENLGEKHFKLAKEHIGGVISTIGKSIIETANDHPDWFEDGEDSDFAHTCKAIGSMGEMIDNIAQGIQAYANLKVPVFGPDGNPKEYRTIEEGDFTNAGTFISKIISSIGDTVEKVYNEHPGWFDGGQDSKFMNVISSCVTMGEMISSISEGIQAYAGAQIPTKWDPKTGQPIEFRSLDIEKDTEAASTAVTTILTTLGRTIVYLYQGKDIEGKQLEDITPDIASQMFNYGTDNDKDSIFTKVLESCTLMGEMISSIAEGVSAYASLSIPIAWDSNGHPTKFQKMKPGTFTEAAQAISNVITTLGKGILQAVETHKDWFEAGVLKKAGGFLGTQEIQEPNPNDPPFIVAMNGCALMGKVISNIAEGVAKFAEGTTPIFDKSGKKIIGYKGFGQQMYTMAAKSISQVILIIGQTLEKVYNENPKLFKGDNAKNITDACLKMSNMVSNVARGIKQMANLRYAIEWDPDGKPTKWKNLGPDDFTNAAEGIKKVLTTVAEGVVAAADSDVFKETDKINNMIDSVNKSIKMISTVANIIQKYAAVQLTKDNVLVTIVQRFSAAVAEIDKIHFDTQVPYNEGDKSKKIISLANSLKTLVEVAEYSKDSDGKGYITIKDGINHLSSAVNSIQSQENFKQHNIEIAKYVSSINKLSISRVDKLNALVTSMNILAQRLGNVDKLTEAIADKLSQELAKLTSELKLAKQTIETAEKIQKNRHELIKNQVKAISEMMDKTLTIEIRQVDDNTSLTNGGKDSTTTSETPSPSSTSSNSTSGGASVPASSGSVPPADSTPSNGKPANKPANSNYNSGAKPSYGEKDIEAAIKMEIQNTHWTGTVKDGKIHLKYSNT